MKRLAALLPILALIACAAPTPQTVLQTVIVEHTAQPLPTYTPYPTYTPPEPLPTYTLYPTYTVVPTATTAPKPTKTPKPTETPKPTNTPTLEPPTEPLVIEGTGDKVVDPDWPPSMPAVIHITGNAAARHFAVTSYDASGDYVDLLVNTSDPYGGYRNYNLNAPTARLEISATGPWTITLLPLHPDHLGQFVVRAPGTYQGTGDTILFIGGEPDTATITGNADNRHFSVISYDSSANYLDLLVNTSDAYEGTIRIAPDTAMLDVKAVGNWTIELNTR